MGREVSAQRFDEAHFADFSNRIREETDTLREWLASGHLSGETGCCGLELEGWLVDEQFQPAPRNQEFLGALQNPQVVPELSRYNFELNSEPVPWQPDTLPLMQQDLDALWQQCTRVAGELNVHAMMIGILPTIRDEHLTLAQVSSQQRYLALNRQVLKLRGGQPLHIRIDGPAGRLRLEHQDVMAEAATTSLQVHLQVAPQAAVRYYNAAQVAAAPLIALSANAPCLFGQELWNETRIPLFEQSVMLASGRDPVGRLRRRVAFGHRYLQDSLIELFEENIRHFPPLLPERYERQERLPHLRLHNGTIWRWNRPLIGFDAAGKPHFRLELRAAPAGPTTTDTIANIAFMLGAVRSLAAQETPPECQLPLVQARENFYRAARYGLDCSVRWTDGRDHCLRTLIVESLLPAARAALLDHGFDPAAVSHYIDGIIAPRVAHGPTGAEWQRRYLHQHGNDPQSLTAAYFNHQQSGLPVHRWPI